MDISSMNLGVEKVFVVHVKTGYESRRKLIEKQLKERAITFDFMLDGDISDLNQQVLETYFTGRMKTAGPETSCAMKHILIYKKMVEENIPGALILEDDAILAPDFNSIFNKAMTEAAERSDINSNLHYISFENSGLKFIANASIKKDQLLYRHTEPRCTGGYFITNGLATLFYTEVVRNKMELPIDWWQRRIFETGGMDVLWCQPAIVEQGSHNGTFISTIQNKKRQGLWRKLSWKVQKFYKMNIYTRVHKK